MDRRTFNSPEVARVGITEHEAADHGGRVAYLPLSEVDRGMITGETDGFVKLIVGPRPLLRNAGVVASSAPPSWRPLTNRVPETHADMRT